MQSHAMSFMRNTALCACLFISACALGEISLVDQHSATGRHRATADGLVGRLGYVPRPLQPNNCGTPDAFKACMVTATRPERPSVLIEELGGGHTEFVAPTTSALLDYSRKIEVGKHDGFFIEHRARKYCTIRRDDRAA